MQCMYSVLFGADTYTISCEDEVMIATFPVQVLLLVFQPASMPFLSDHQTPKTCKPCKVLGGCITVKTPEITWCEHRTLSRPWELR